MSSTPDFIHAHFTSGQDGTSLFLHPGGGRVVGAEWTALANAAKKYGDGYLYLHYHSTIEIRGIKDAELQSACLDDLADVEAARGACSVTASPLSSEARLFALELAGLLRERGVSHEETVAVDGGAGDAAASGAHFTVRRSSHGGWLVTTGDHGDSAGNETATAADAPSVATIIAASSAERAIAHHSGHNPAQLDHETQKAHMPIGWLAEHTAEGLVDLGAGLYKGVLPAAVAGLFGQAELTTTVTPWRGIVFHDLPEGDAEAVLRVLAPRGLIFDINSPHLHA